MRALVLLAVLAGAARADVWTSAIERGSADSSRDRYAAAMEEGDSKAEKANARSNSAKVINTLVDEAIRAYETAAAARPTEGEPFFRIASVLESYYTDCNSAIVLGQRPPMTCNAPFDAARAAQAVKAWESFEQRAPLDPRVGEALFARAILRTKLVENGGKDIKQHLEGAMRDYKSILDHSDGLSTGSADQVWGNLAETYMMLGHMDEAIEAYKVALDMGGDTSTAYGLAVALDRDERSSEALELVRRQGLDAFDGYRRKLQLQLIFYVPRGEEQYYFGLIYEALGYNTESIAAWNAFIKSGAHPQYQARAKWHIDQLAKKPVTRPRALDPFDAYP